MDPTIVTLAAEVRRLRRILYSTCIAGVAIVVFLGAATVSQSRRDDLTVRQLHVVDENGVERVRIGAPLPDPIVHGKRTKRDGPISGVLIFDRTGTERGGYATDDEADGNAVITLDDGHGEDQLTIVSYALKGAELGLRAHKEMRFYVSALNDRTRMRLQHGNVVLLDKSSDK